MPTTTKKLLDDVLKLPRKTRAMIAERIIDSLDEYAGIDAAIKEAERRWTAYKEGKIKAIPVEDVFPNLASKRKRRVRR